jgi:hypothetical protein
MPKHPLTRREIARLLALMPAAAIVSRGAQASPRRLRRADSFFGLHFDLHPAKEDTALGRDVNEAMVQSLLDAAKPDYVQYDSKGHAGWLGWKSEVGPSAPGIVNDSLAVWRRVTARNGVSLYIHFSGVWDSEAVRRHPDWARVDGEGRIDKRQTSTFGPYADALMIPQLREAATKYDLEGAWVDGECWATHPDFRESAVEAFKKATGRTEAPRSPKDEGWNEFLEFNRERFRQYVKHYVTEVHKTHPRFQIASNWLYSTFVPEEPTLPVDFLSGDYLGNASISTARVEARYLAQTGKPWDLMAWGFQQADSNAIGHVYKPAVQLQQEASVVLAQGGGFQVYYVPSRAGHFEESHVKVMGEVAKFCRAREKSSHKSESVPQIGVVFSKETLYNTTNKLFGGWGKLMDPARGWIDALTACQWSVDVLPDWKLARMASRYPLIVLPDWAAPGEAVHSALDAYVKAGGNLIVCGAANARRWASAIGMSAMGEAEVEETFLTGGEVLAIAKGLWQRIEPGAGTVLEWRVPDHDSRKDRQPAAVSGTLGKGRVAIIPGPIGVVYAATHATTVREFVMRAAKPMFRPMVEVSGPPTVEVSLRRKDGALLVHLLNTTGMQVAGDFASIDFVPPVGPVRLKFNSGAPKSVRLEPEGTELKAPYEVSRLEVHSIARVVF